jgi:hypothetical protein
MSDKGNELEKERQEVFFHDLRIGDRFRIDRFNGVLLRIDPEVFVNLHPTPHEVSMLEGVLFQGAVCISGELAGRTFVMAPNEIVILEEEGKDKPLVLGYDGFLETLNPGDRFVITGYDGIYMVINPAYKILVGTLTGISDFVEGRLVHNVVCLQGKRKGKFDVVARGKFVTRIDR